tara:strand:+ start:2294 stop:3034 length:741 start_codon:yes stop_codon:yes gene_type:complete
MRTKTVFFIIITMIATISVSSFVSGKILFKDNFEDDNIGKPPKNWVVGFEGKDDAKVVQDPERGKNKVFSSPTERHDVKGAIYITGKGENWTDYYVQWEMLFPKDFYMGIVFRFSGGESFYLLDRRQNSKQLDFWKRQGGWKNFGTSEDAQGLAIEKWWSFQLKISGKDFEVKMKNTKKEKREFKQLDPVLEATQGEFKKGDFGNYGHVLLDNVVIATELNDFINPWAVSPDSNYVTTWSRIKTID